jgi:hypothetical protein
MVPLNGTVGRHQHRIRESAFERRSVVHSLTDRSFADPKNACWVFKLD